MLGLTLLFGLAGSVVFRGTGFANAIFGNLVAVTGDAHQAQVAQDIFRADVRHELSLLIREDMRDVHALMSETVSTQVTTGSIVLGVCFSVLVEGYVQAASAQWVIEMWALLTAWAAMLTFASLLLALYFQMAIKSAARERLLMKHRVFMPGDTAISSLGGYTLAEKVGLFHAGIVGRLVGLAQQLSSIAAPAAQDGTPEEPAGGDAKDAPRQRPSQHWTAAELQEQNPLQVTLDFDCETVPCSLHGSCLLSDPRLLMTRAKPGAEAWYDEQTHQLTPHKIGELPGFLVGSTLVRQPWFMREPKKLQLQVQQEATIYVAARVYAPGSIDEALASDPSASPPAKLLPGSAGAAEGFWAQEDMPRLLRGAHESFPWFQKVEGFTVYVADQKESLPLYKAALQAPMNDEPVDVEIEWNFDGCVESLLVIVREGCVLTTEEEFPKRAFLQELEVLKPHLNFSTLYSQCGMSCLLLAVVFMHMARISVVRPYPRSSDEIIAVMAAAAVGLVGIWTRWRLAHAGRGFTEQEQDAVPKLGSGDGSLSPRTPAGITPGGRPKRVITARFNGIVSNKLWQQRRRNWWKLAMFSCALGILFVASVGWCLSSVVLDFFGSPSSDVPQVAAGRWWDWPVRWPPLFQPVAATMSPDGSTWAASGWAVAAFGAGQAPGPPVRLPSAVRGLAHVGGRLLVADEENRLRLLQMSTEQSASSLAGSASALAARLFAEAALLGEPLDLPEEPGGGSAVSLSGAPAMRLWASADANSTSTAEGVLAVAYSAGQVVLYSTGPSTNSSTKLRLEALLQLYPLVPGSPVPDGSRQRELRAIHLCAVGPLAAKSGQAWLWAGDSTGRLTALGLSSGTRVEVEPPWPVDSGRSIVALAGNATHMLAVASSSKVRVAAFEELLPPSAWEAAPEL